MTDTLPFLKQLISASGLSGHEAPIRSLIEEAWKPLTDELSVSRLGSLHGLRRGSGLQPRPSILIATHMDAIGLMVTGMVDGFLRVTSVGGIDVRILPGQPVIVHGRQDLPAMIVQLPDQLLPHHVQNGATSLEYLIVDTGLLPERLRRLVRVGDPVSFAQEPFEAAADTLVGHTLDNRASIAALTLCLDELQNRTHAWDVWAVATVQEEVTLGGAMTSTFQLHPSVGVAIDVTFASSPGSPSHRTYPLGKGPTLAMGPNMHPALLKALQDTADRFEIPYSLEITPRHSGTDVFAMQVTAEGIPCMVVGIPLRYMHTPVEMVSLKDIKRTGRLLAEFIAGLDADFVNQLTWDD
ncbi:MAG: M20/M25/M40 family metallo-hydrolase [Anaerolineales bacterium]|nr:M20/M25/M40 family metallo-hydrolase [Anaerolineales bacterium]